MQKLLISLLLCLPLTAGESSWPRFRGTGGSGLSESPLPTRLSQETLVWSAKLPGAGSSSPVIWEDKLFLTSENRDRHTISLLCLDAHSGKGLWDRPLKVGDYHLHRFNNTAASTPAISEDRVVVPWFDGPAKTARLTAFDHQGEKIWDFHIGSFQSEHGFCLNPVIHQDSVIVAPLHMGDGFVARISLADGKVVWRKPHPGGGKKTSYITPCLLETGQGSEVVLASHAQGVWALDFASGRENWSLPGCLEHRTIVSPFQLIPGQSSATLIGVACKTGAYLAIRPPGEPGGKAEIAWRMKGKTPYVPTPVAQAGMVFSLSDGGALTAVDATSGETKWTKQLRANFYASPLIADEHLYAVTREGELIVSSLSEGYREISRNALNPAPGSAEIDATPAIAHGRLYLRVGDRLDCHAKR